MAVYVDKLRPCRWKIRGKLITESCHLFSDDITELHSFASLLGLKQDYFQERKRFPHYDLTPPMRIRALNLGAKGVRRIREVVG